MSENSFDPIRDRLSKILRDAQPEYGSHLLEEDIIALAGQKPGPGDPLPDHLRTCSWCCRRVFEARRKVALERARPRLLSLSMAIGRKAVQFLKAAPGMQEVYAFSQPSYAPPPDTGIRMMYSPRVVQTESLPAAPPTEEVKEVPEYQERDYPRSEIALSVFSHEHIVTPSRTATDVIPLSFEGLEGRLTVLRGELFMMTLRVLETETAKPVPGITLSLKGEGIDQDTQTNEDGMASLIRIPEGHFTLEIVAPRSP